MWKRERGTGGGERSISTHERMIFIGSIYTLQISFTCDIFYTHPLMSFAGIIYTRGCYLWVMLFISISCHSRVCFLHTREFHFPVAILGYFFKI